MLVVEKVSSKIGLSVMEGPVASVVKDYIIPMIT